MPGCHLDWVGCGVRSGVAERVLTRSKIPRWGEDERFLPDFCSVRAVFVLLLLAELLALLVALIAADRPSVFWDELGLSSLFIVWVVLVGAALLCGLRRWMNALAPPAAAAVVFCVIQLDVALTGWAASVWFPEGFGTSAHPAAAPLFAYLRSGAVAGLVAALWLHYLYLQYQWRRQVKAESLARLDALQARMRPHFLFNGLNTIASLISRDAAKAEELTLDFAELFRVLLKKDARMARLEEEIQLLRQYLNIEQQRLAERLRVVWNLGDTPMDALLPPLSLQPLVENAVYHGVEPLPGGGMIEIAGEARRGEVVLTVRSPAPAPEAAIRRAGNRQALANLRLRLENCFPGHGQVQNSMVDGRYQARIIIPYRTSLDEDPGRG